MTAVDPLLREHITRGHLPTEDRVARIAETQRLRRGSDGAADVRSDLSRSVLGLGPLDALVQDEQVTDLVVNGVNGVFVDRGEGLRRCGVDLSDERALRRLAVRLAGQAGQRLDDASPCVDGLLPGGVRLHAVLPPLVEGGAHISLRIPRRTVPGLATLRAWGLCDAATERLLADLVRRRLSFVIGGGTGSGKTTLLAALLSLVPAGERIVVVEDTRELRVDHPHVVHLQGRGANVEGRGQIDLVTLVRQSLRMRPDRLVLGEVRGAEVRELLTALNTGHEGGCGTVHANSARDVVTRFEALGALAGLDAPAVHAQLASAVRVVVHLGRVAGRREVTQVALLQRSPATGVVGAVIVVERVGGQMRRGPAWDPFQELLTGGTELMTAVLLVGLACLLWPGRGVATAVATVGRARGKAAGRTSGPHRDGATGPAFGPHRDGVTGRGLPGLWHRPSGLLTRRVTALLARVRPGRGSAEKDGAGVLALLDGLGAALAAGLAPAQAVRVAQTGPVSPALAPALAHVLDAAVDGRPTGPAWERVARRHAHPDLICLARAWSLSERLGCPLAEAVRTTARSARTRTLLQQRLASATAGARATSGLLSALPLGGVAVALLLGIDPLVLYGSPLALGALGCGLLLLLLGRVAVRRMIDRVLRGVPA